MNERKRVVVIGGGYAGALAAARLGRQSQLQVVLVAPGGGLVHRVRLYRAIARRPDAAVVIPLATLLGPRVEIWEATAHTIDPDSQTVTTTRGELAYDALVVATGSVGLPTPVNEAGLGGSGPWVVPVEVDAMQALRARLPQRNTDKATVVVVGGGPTAVELAGALATDWPGLRVSMVSPEPTLAVLGAVASARVRRRLHDIGVSIVQARVTGVDSAGARLNDGRVLPAAEVLWATGVVAGGGALLQALGGQSRRDGRVAVLPTLQVVGRPSVFVVGDAAVVPGVGGEVATGCKSAMPMAAHAADNVRRLLAGDPLSPFRYRDPGSTVAVGDWWALGASNADVTAPRVVVGAAVLGLVKWLLCWYVLAAIRWQARGWLDYRWRRGSMDDTAATEDTPQQHHRTYV